MSAPLLTISVDLETGARRLMCGSCAADTALDPATGSPTRSAIVATFVSAHTACHRSRPEQARDDSTSVQSD